jgi:hypothetical protein
LTAILFFCRKEKAMAAGNWVLDPLSATLPFAAAAGDSDADGLRLSDGAGEDEVTFWDDAWIDLGGEA